METSFAWAIHSPTLPIRCCCRVSLWSRNTLTGISPRFPQPVPRIPVIRTDSILQRAPTGNLQKGSFADWRLSVEGLVSRPGTYSLSDLKRFPARTQITRHVCEEGWTAIAEWTGVPLSRVLDAAGICPRRGSFSSTRTISGPMASTCSTRLHPQTLLTYGMNGRDLSVPHGAPLRLRVERQMGYKTHEVL